MPLKFEQIQPGDVLYERKRQKLGNTTASKVVEWSMRVIEVDRARWRALISWNGNPATWRYAGEISRYFRTSLREKQAKKEKKLDKLLVVAEEEKKAGPC